jgi:hypothetical protein
MTFHIYILTATVYTMMARTEIYLQEFLFVGAGMMAQASYPRYLGGR